MGTNAAFVSYSNKDSAFVQRLVRDLIKAGTAIWLDKFEIKPGTEWDRAVEAALIACPRVLLVLSPTSATSTNVLDEISVAIRMNKTIIPILYQDCAIPMRVSRLQYVDFSTDYKEGLAALLPHLVPTEDADTGLHSAEVVKSVPAETAEPEARKSPETVEVKTGERYQHRWQSWRKVWAIALGCVAALTILILSVIRLAGSKQIPQVQNPAAKTSQTQLQTLPVNASPPEPEVKRDTESAIPQHESANAQSKQALQSAIPASKIRPAKNTPKIQRQPAPVNTLPGGSSSESKTAEHQAANQGGPKTQAPAQSSASASKTTPSQNTSDTEITSSEITPSLLRKIFGAPERQPADTKGSAAPADARSPKPSNSGAIASTTAQSQGASTGAPQPQPTIKSAAPATNIPTKSSVGMGLRGLLGESEKDALAYLGAPGAKNDPDPDSGRPSEGWLYKNRGLKLLVTKTDGTINKMCFYQPASLGGHGKTLEVMEGILPGMKRSAIEARIGKPTEEPQESGDFITVWYANLIPRIDVEIGYSVYALETKSLSFKEKSIGAYVICIQPSTK